MLNRLSLVRKGVDGHGDNVWAYYKLEVILILFMKLDDHPKLHSDRSEAGGLRGLQLRPSQILDDVRLVSPHLCACVFTHGCSPKP